MTISGVVPRFFQYMLVLEELLNVSPRKHNSMSTVRTHRPPSIPASNHSPLLWTARLGNVLRLSLARASHFQHNVMIASTLCGHFPRSAFLLTTKVLFQRPSGFVNQAGVIMLSDALRSTVDTRQSVGPFEKYAGTENLLTLRKHELPCEDIRFEVIRTRDLSPHVM